ncbi:hypothetical protein DRB96_37405 [Streptomyces sp. ICC1]|nr:hypothetical protein DRB96_37405 [Streptomyces sp. ICC1]
MSAPVPGLEPPAPAQPGGASGPRSVAAGVNGGVISTGDRASIDARTQILPREAFSSPAEVAASAGLNNLPLPASALFFGRDDEMRRLWAAMRGTAAVVTQAVHGLGGVGKSTLALHYAHTHRDQYTLVWWLTASSPDTIETGLAELALRLHPARRSLPDTTTEHHAQWATGWLQAHPGWLLIVDNAEHPDHIAPLIGQLAGGHHLITTRRAIGWHHLTTHPIALDVLAPDAAVELLINITGQTGERDRQDAAHLAAELGFLPLALEQAGAYIQHNQTTHARYLAQLASRPARMFATPAGGTARGGDARREPHDRTALGEEHFHCAPGPSGWRYGSEGAAPDGGHRGSVGLAVDVPGSRRRAGPAAGRPRTAAAPGRPGSRSRHPAAGALRRTAGRPRPRASGPGPAGRRARGSWRRTGSRRPAPRWRGRRGRLPRPGRSRSGR